MIKNQSVESAKTDTEPLTNAQPLLSDLEISDHLHQDRLQPTTKQAAQSLQSSLSLDQEIAESNEPITLISLTFKQVGEKLAQIRESKGLTLEEVASRIKISVSKIEALEKGQTETLPSEIFALGMIRSYAKVLHIDSELLIKPLKTKRLYENYIHDLQSSVKKQSSTSHFAFSRWVDFFYIKGNKLKRLLWIVSACILVLVVVQSWKIYSQSQREKSSVPIDKMSEITTLNNANFVKQLSEKKLTQAGQLANQVSLPVDQTNTATSHSVVKVAAASQLANIASSKLLIQVGEDCWYWVKDKNNQILFSGVLKAGSQQLVQGVEPFSIVVGNRSALQSLTLNGKKVDLSKYPQTDNDVLRLNV